MRDSYDHSEPDEFEAHGLAVPDDEGTKDTKRALPSARALPSTILI
jgi:hypothetical protein